MEDPPCSSSFRAMVPPSDGEQVKVRGGDGREKWDSELLSSGGENSLSSGEGGEGPPLLASDEVEGRMSGTRSGCPAEK